MKSVYLAGPDVFRADADQAFGSLLAKCSERGLLGLVPSDGGLSRGFEGSPREVAERIYQENLALIARADAALANACAFRGVEPDSGTAFEIGYARALGKPIAIVEPTGLLHEERVERACGSRLVGGEPFCKAENLRVESFGLPLNLMLAFSGSCHRGVDEALDDLARRLGL